MLGSRVQGQFARVVRFTDVDCRVIQELEDVHVVPHRSEVGRLTTSSVM